MKPLLDLLGRPFAAYAHWLHTRWPAGVPEKLPVVGEGGVTALPGVRVVGDLTGVPLLKFALDGGARAVRAIMEEPAFAKLRGAADGRADLAIVGAGVAGMAAAVEARKLGLRFRLFEASEPFSTIANFPKAKPIFTFPTDMTPAGDLQVRAEVKEELLAELEAQRAAAGIEPERVRIERIERKGDLLLLHPAGGGEPVKASRAVVAIGRSGNFRKLGVSGESLDKVSNRLHDPKEFAGKDVLVVGGGDSALETAIALGVCGARVTLSYRKKEFARPKPGNLEKLRALSLDPAAPVAVERPSSERVTTAAHPSMRGGGPAGSVRLALGTRPTRITESEVFLAGEDGAEERLPNDAVFSMIGREAPLDFFRRSGIPVSGEWRAATWVGFLLFFLFSIFLYHWKKPGAHIADFPPFSWIAGIGGAWKSAGWFPYGLGEPLAASSGALGKVLSISLSEPGFFYSLAYCLCVLLFGIDRIRRRKTPYVRAQTITLTLIQWVPLFLLPYLLLPLAGALGAFDAGIGKGFADALFPEVAYGHGREYWRAFGLVLAWPLFIWNAFTEQPLWAWLGISLAQTFVVIPIIVLRWGKGAYCGWICSCGALAETLGDRHRHKMPHGPFWNRLNMVGQAFLAFALALMALRTAGWVMGPGSWPSKMFGYLLGELPLFNYVWFVDLFWAGILGVGLYFHFSGRVWCRFACPLAALMHLYARFTKFRIFADKKKCISCNVCTSVCHQGIDIMNFANKGLAMEDPECVRCSACVQGCPTGVLSFGRLGPGGLPLLDKLQASPVRAAESPKA